MLQVDGLITTEPHRGSIVRTYGTTELEDIFRLRALLESYGAQQAAERRTAADLRSLEASIERIDAFNVEQVGVKEIWQENVAFHTAVAAAAHSAKLTTFVRNLLDLPIHYHRPLDYSVEQKDAFVRSHRRILEALQMRDSELAQLLMKTHILEARDFAIEQTEHQAAPSPPTTAADADQASNSSEAIAAK